MEDRGSVTGGETVDPGPGRVHVLTGSCERFAVASQGNAEALGAF